MTVYKLAGLAEPAIQVRADHFFAAFAQALLEPVPMWPDPMGPPSITTESALAANPPC